MARRTENECAYCAEEIEREKRVVGKDWKVYCSTACARAGEEMSRGEWQKLMRFVTSRRELVILEQGL